MRAPLPRGELSRRGRIFLWILCFFEANRGVELRLVQREFKRVVFEALIVAALGLAFALVANAISPRGLSLTRNYFPKSGRAPVNPPLAPTNKGNHTFSPANGQVSASAGATATVAVRDPVAERLRAEGLQPIDRKETDQLFRDPLYEQGLIVFVDARNDEHYEQGHIPGAYQFDRYYPEKHLPGVLPACLNAMKVVVYCTGGSCEDSEFAALALKDAGVAPEHLFVYLGGITDWATNGLQVEIGAYKSGNVRGEKR